jgi:hypothetical protein
MTSLSARGVNGVGLFQCRRRSAAVRLVEPAFNEVAPGRLSIASASAEPLVASDAPLLWVRFARGAGTHTRGHMAAETVRVDEASAAAD